jgi:hypothetical protein
VILAHLDLSFPTRIQTLTSGPAGLAVRYADVKRIRFMIRRFLGHLSARLKRDGEMSLAEQRVVHGIPVRIVNTRPDIQTEQAIQRLSAALDLIATYAPRRYRRLREDFAGFVVQRFACRGAFFPESRECLVELTFTVNPRHVLPEIAASIVHEATHARVAQMCGRRPAEQHAREERLCRRAELELGLALPDGTVVVQRARASLALLDQEVAPAVDWAEAARRVAEVDAQARKSH